MSTYIRPPESDQCEWCTGFPAEPGWYPASFKFPPDPSTLRYYFGDGVWSKGYAPSTDASWFELFGGPEPIDDPRDDIMWSQPWWPVVEQGG